MPVSRRCILALFAALVLAASGLARAGSSTVNLLLDLDRNGATGCTVNLAGGSMAGVERVYSALASTTTSTATVLRLERRICAGGVLGAPEIYDAGTWPVGMGNGQGGMAVIEASLPLAAFTPGVQPLARVSTDNGLGGEDASANFNIVWAAADNGAVPVPLSPALLLALAAALALLAAHALRRGTVAGRFLGVLAVCLVSSLVLAATAIRDGQIGDWAGVPPALTDPTGDAPPNADLIAVFYQQDATQLYLRYDVDVRFDAVTGNQAPQISNLTNGTLSLPNHVLSFDPTITDDGLPAPASLSYSWTRLSGPAPVYFGTNAASPPDLSTPAATAAAQASTRRNPAAFFDTFATGNYVLRFAASDGALTSTRDLTITVGQAAGNAQPQIGPIPNQILRLGETLELALAGSIGNGAGPLSYSLLSAPAGATLNPLGSPFFRFTPSAAQVGSHGASIEVRDPLSQSAQASFNITVLPANRPPVFTAASKADGNASVAGTFSRQLQANDPDVGDSLNFALLGGPAGMAVNAAGAMTWTPGSGQLGEHVVKVRVSDAAGAMDVALFTVRVAGNSAPVAADDEYRVSINGTLVVDALSGVLANDRDPDTGDNTGLSALLAAGPAVGNLSSFAPDGGFTFQAPASVPGAPLSWLKQRNFNRTWSYGAHEVIGDLNGDGAPDIIAHNLNADIRASSGADGTELWAIDTTGASDCQVMTGYAANHRVLADIDDSGHPAYVFTTSCGRDGSAWADRIIAFDHLGKVKWVSPPVSKQIPEIRRGAIPVPPGGFNVGGMTYTRGLSVARLTAAGAPTLLMRAEITANDGYLYYVDEFNAGQYAGCRAITGLVADQNLACRATVLISGIDGSVQQVLVAPNPTNTRISGGPDALKELPPIAFDIDGDGRVDLVSGGEVWKQNAGGGFDLAWQANAPVNDTAVADLDGDGQAEILFLRNSTAGSTNSGLFIHAQDGTLLRRVPLQTYWFTPMTIADVDGDGRSDIVFGAEGKLLALRDDGRVIWSYVVPNEVPSDPIFGPHYTPEAEGFRVSNSAPQVYDLDGDGIKEVIFAAESRIMVLDGRSGERKLDPYWTFSRTYNDVGTLALVDMNNDGQVDIVQNAAFRFNCGFAGFPPGACDSVVGPVVMAAGAGTSWNPGPKAWHQLQYRASSIGASSQVLHDTSVARVFRTPEQQGSVGDPRLAQATSFTYTASDGNAASAPARVVIRIEPENRPPVFTSTPPRSLWQHFDPNPPGALITHYYQPAALDPDAGDTVSFSLKSAPVWVTIDSGTGRIRFEPTCGSYGYPCPWGWTFVVVTATDNHGASTDQAFLVNLTTTTATVPNVLGLALNTAVDNLHAAKLNGVVFAELHDTSAAGTVLAQEASAGTVVGEMDEVRLTVSKGPAPVLVPNVVGLAETLALSRLTSAGFTPGITRQFGPQPRGTVISQSLAAGSSVVPGSIGVVISGGSGLELKLGSAAITAGNAISLIPLAYDAAGNPAPLPVLSYSITPRATPYLGSLPTVASGQINTAAATLGSFTVTATDSALSRSASADFVVLKAPPVTGSSNGTVIGGMMRALEDMEAIARQLKTARVANDVPLMTSLLTQYVSTWRGVDVARLKLTVPIVLPVGFAATETEMQGFGLSPTAEDHLIQQIMREASDDLQAWAAGLKDSGTSMNELRTLADNFSLRAGRINGLLLSEYGGAMNNPEMIQLIGHDIPEFYEALTDELAVVVGLPRRTGNYPSMKRGTGGKSTLAEQVVTMAVDMVVEKIMDQAAQTYKNAKKFAADTLGYAAYSAAVMAAYSHLKEFAYGKDLVETVSGASLSFRVFNSPYAFIEILSPTRRHHLFNVMVIGPSLFTDAYAGINQTIEKMKEALSYGQNVLTNPNKVKDADDLFKIHDEFKEKVDEVINSGSNTLKKAAKQFYQSPQYLETSCVFTSGLPCKQLHYGLDGFESVYEYQPPPGFAALTGIPVPIIFIVQDPVTGDAHFGLYPFLPTVPAP
ncbi:Serine/threonine-protein kinase PK-1 [Burkholderiales bacterium]|nr:Serine/threonine-protein kinase PK-1 [Burkholderiales bacterium]